MPSKVLYRAAATFWLMAVLLHGQASSAPGALDAGGKECRVVPKLPSHVQLNNGVIIPRIGFGTAGLGQATEEAVAVALTAGYRHIDTAQAQEWYREEAVGRALKQATLTETDLSPREEEGESFTETSGATLLPREHVFVTTKIHPRDYGAERLGIMVEASSSNLQGVDLLLLHAPFCWPGSCPVNPAPWQDAWRQLEDLYSKGAVRAIGVSNFSESLLRELLGMATVTPAAVQNWMDPFHQDRAVRALCAEHGIAYIAYSTLGGQWAHRPSSSSSPNPVSTDPTLIAIASAHGTSVQTVALSWALQSGAIILPRSSNLDRIKGNHRAFMKVDDTFSSLRDRGDGKSEGAGNGGGSAKQRCGIAGESNSGAVVEVLLTVDDMRAVDRLDGSIGN
ncbi:unnamed protein product [Ectocarpus sp. 12 AP-2014]